MASNGQNHFVLTLLLIVTIWTSGIVQSRMVLETSLLETYEKWMAKYNKVYKDVSEKEKRFEIFKKNVQYIESFNSNSTKSYKLDINKFADQTDEELKAIRNGLKKSPSGSPKTKSLFRYENVTDLPDSLDWTQKGAVTGVKDQGHCGSCWAFSAIAAIEGVHQLTTGQLVSLSEQVLLDCDHQERDQGCNGGYMEDAFDFIIKNGGITSDFNYPYTASNEQCDTNKLQSHDAQIKGYEHVPTNNELELQKAVANQPVSTYVDSGPFHFYSSGIFDGECGTRLDHGVTIVGYGKTDDGTEYWLVKNSWGTDWGEDGYIRMKRNIDAKEGLCGIAKTASYPTS